MIIRLRARLAQRLKSRCNVSHPVTLGWKRGVHKGALSPLGLIFTANLEIEASPKRVYARHSRIVAAYLGLFPGRRNTVTVVFPPPISGATKLYTPTKPETTATFCTPRAL
jgi:hypothetical protein